MPTAAAAPINPAAMATRGSQRTAGSAGSTKYRVRGFVGFVGFVRFVRFVEVRGLSRGNGREPAASAGPLGLARVNPVDRGFRGGDEMRRRYRRSSQALVRGLRLARENARISFASATGSADETGGSFQRGHAARHRSESRKKSASPPRRPVGQEHEVRHPLVDCRHGNRARSAPISSMPCNSRARRASVGLWLFPGLMASISATGIY